MDESEIIRKIAKGGMLAAAAAMVRLLIAKNESWMQRVRGYLAGVIAGTLAAYIMIDSKLSPLSSNLIVVFVSMTIRELWPLIEAGVQTVGKKWINKKVRDVGGIDDN